MKAGNTDLNKLPAVEKLLSSEGLSPLINNYGRELVKYAIRQVLAEIRKSNAKTSVIPEVNEIISLVKNKATAVFTNSLKPVINGTGILIHTNLGRSPIGADLCNDTAEILKGYNNLEFDLETGKRGSRHAHLIDILKYLTGAEDALVVNNNAAAVMLVLRVFAKNYEVIVSRSELIEIGGSFRLPDIMAASDCKMVEIGTTNKTRLSDYEHAINEQTRLIFKTHKSNFTITGFTEEVAINELIATGKKKKVPVIYDLGSGLLHKAGLQEVADEPDVKSAVRLGADMVCFSGDKLLGGPQAGIIVGKKKYIAKLKKEQMTRALRVGKITIAYLEAACRNYLFNDHLYKRNVLFNLVNQGTDVLAKKADLLKVGFEKHLLAAEVIKDDGQFGGGTLPDVKVPSFAVVPSINCSSSKARTRIAKLINAELMKCKLPVVTILRKGKILINVLTIFDDNIEYIAETTAAVIKKCQE